MMKGLHIISDFNELQLLSNRLAYQILLEIQKGPASGAQIAEKLGIKNPRVIYYLKKMEKYGLAELVKQKPQRGNREKFYRATAREFLISAGITGSDDVKTQVNAGISNTYMDHFLNNVMNFDMDTLVDSIIDDYLRVKHGENVIISFNERNIELLKKIIIKLRNIGVQYRTHLSSTDITQNFWSSVDISNVETHFDQVKSEVDWADVWLTLWPTIESDISDIPDDRVKTIATLSGQVNVALSTKSGLRGLTVYNPPNFENEFFTDPNILERLKAYWEAVSLSKTDFEMMKTIGDYIIDAGAFVIETGESNELKVDLDIEHYFIDAGPLTYSTNEKNTYYVPSGEAALLPREGGVNGEIFCEFCDFAFDNTKGVHLTIENSIVTDVKADTGLERLQTLFDGYGQEGRTVSQICFGMNPAVRDIELLPELAGKLYGSFYLVFGNNTMLGGTITQPGAWGLVSVSPRAISDGKLFLSDGEFDI